MKIPLMRWIDRVVGIILIIPIWLVSLPFPKAKLETKRIMIIKLWALGDSVVLLPAIQEIRKKYPKAKIDVLCRDRVKTVFDGLKFIDEIKSAEPKGLLKLIPKLRSYDVVLDSEPYLNISALLGWWLGKRRIGFSHGVRKLLYTDRVVFNDKQHMVKTYIDLAGPLGITNVPDKLVPLEISRSDVKRVDELFKEWGIKKGDKIVCIAPGAAESARSRIWPAKKYAKVADALVKEFLVKVIITGTKGERFFAENIAKEMKYSPIIATGETSVKQTAEMYRRSSLMIGNDSGPMHLSAAMGAKTIGLFCPNTPVRWAPYGPGNDYVFKPVLPKPCINTHLGQMPDCNDHKHMSLIKSQDVIDKARRMLHAGHH
jgi:heptosyltransferase-2